MWNRQELKMRGKMAFKRNYGAAVAVALLMGIISLIFGGGNVTERLQYSDTVEYSGSASQNVIEDFLSSPKGMLFAGIATSIVLVMALVGMVLQYLVENVLIVGGSRFFVLNQTERPGVGTMLDPFRSGHYGNVVLTMFLRDLYVFLWSLLLVVPGIVKSYEYKMVPYILAENPGMDRKEAFLISKQMMEGQKWEAFVLDLSFIGWNILSVFTCGILSVLYVEPYYQATIAEMYSFNKMRANQQGFIR